MKYKKVSKENTLYQYFIRSNMELKIFALLLLTKLTLATHQSERNGKFLSLFNVVSFTNTMCNTTNGQGICYTSSECSSLGGRGDSECAMGFGVCCVFEYDCSSTSKGSQEVFYFQNNGFPEKKTEPSICLFNIQPRNENVCQIRLDFEEFSLDGGSATDKPCDRDFMTIFTGTGSIGVGKLCGSNKGNHLYLPMNEGGNSPMFRVVTDSREGNLTEGYSWRIKITQIDCSSENENIKNLIAPLGCRQYFTEPKGTIRSFNWSPTVPFQYVKNQHYAICIKRSEMDCQLSLKRSSSAPPFSTSIGRVEGATYNDGCGNQNGCSSKDCIDVANTNIGERRNDWIRFNSFFVDQSTLNNNNNQGTRYLMESIYCGNGIGPDQTNNDGTDSGIPVINQGKGPFILEFHSDGNPGKETMKENKDELGFSFDYSIQSSCDDLVLKNRQ